MNRTAGKDDMRAKFRDYGATRDRRLRDELVEANFPLARLLVGRFAASPEPFEDLVQIASIGLVKAVERYDPGYGTEFATFATPTIVGELKRYLRDCTWSFHVPRRDKDLSLEIRSVMDEAQQRFHRAEPSSRELAAHTGLTQSDTIRGQRALTFHNLKPVDVTGDSVDVPLHDDALDQAELRTIVESLLARLEPADRYVVVEYYLRGRTQAEIARDIGRSQMHVSRSLARSLHLLRTTDPRRHPIRSASATPQRAIA